MRTCIPPRTRRDPTPTVAPHPFVATPIELASRRRQTVARFVLMGMAFALVVPARVRDLFDRLLAEGLPDVPLAYPTDWGIPGPGGTRIDVWVEMALGYLYAVPRRLGTQSTMPSRLVSTPRLITANPPRSSGASPSQPNSATR